MNSKYIIYIYIKRDTYTCLLYFVLCTYLGVGLRIHLLPCGLVSSNALRRLVASIVSSLSESGFRGLGFRVLSVLRASESTRASHIRVP